MGPFRPKPPHVLEHEIEQLRELYQKVFLQFTDDTVLVLRARYTMDVTVGAFAQLVGGWLRVRLSPAALDNFAFEVKAGAARRKAARPQPRREL